jgi:hypothetical protein
MVFSSYEGRKTMKQCAKRKSSRHLLRVLVATVFVGLIALAGCSATPAGPPDSTPPPAAIPQRANFLAKVELAEIMNDEDFGGLYHEVAAQEGILPETLDDALDEVQREIGVNLRDFADATVFADALSLPEVMESYPYGADSAYWGVLVRGELDESTFIDGVESKIGKELPRNSYQSLTIYAVTDAHEQDVALSLAFPADGEMVIGADAAVRDFIDVAVGLEEPMSGMVYDLYCELGDALVRLASIVPESLTEQIPAEVPVGPATLSLLCFREIEYATLVIVKDEGIVNAELCLVFSNEDSARDSQSLLWIASKLGASVVPDPNIGELLSGTQISRSGVSVYLTLALTTSEIEELTLALLQEGRQ